MLAAGAAGIKIIAMMPTPDPNDNRLPDKIPNIPTPQEKWFKWLWEKSEMRFEYRPLETQPRATTSSASHSGTRVQELESKIAPSAAEITNLKTEFDTANTKNAAFKTSLDVAHDKLAVYENAKCQFDNGTRPAGSAGSTCSNYKH